MTIDQLSRLVVTYVNRTTPQVSLSQSAPLCMMETKALFKTSLTPGRRFEDNETSTTCLPRNWRVVLKIFISTLSSIVSIITINILILLSQLDYCWHPRHPSVSKTSNVAFRKSLTDDLEKLTGKADWKSSKECNPSWDQILQIALQKRTRCTTVDFKGTRNQFTTHWFISHRPPLMRFSNTILWKLTS